MTDRGEFIDTASARLSLRGDILFMESIGVPSTAETVTETLQAIARLAAGRNVPLLADARNWPGGDGESWARFIKSSAGHFTAIAAVVDGEATPDLGSYGDVIDRLIVPFRVFTDMDRAIAFLEPYRPD